MKRKVKKEKVRENPKIVTKLRRTIREMQSTIHFKEARIKNLEFDLKTTHNLREREIENVKAANREKDRFYTESNQKTTKLQRLENAVKCLKEAHQKTLLAFDTLA